MRQLGLLLLLLVAVSSSEVKREISNDIREYIDIVKCFLNQENLLNDIVSFVDVIKSGEYDKLLSLAFKLYADGTAAVKECIKTEEVQLELINNVQKTTPRIITKAQCKAACKKMYVGYQLSICTRLC